MRSIEIQGKRARMAAQLINLAGVLTSKMDHRGFYNLTQIVGQCAPQGTACVVELLPDSKYQLDLRDPYWNRLVYRGFTYEPEVEHLLYHLRNIPYTFIDGGANGGYWSVLASSQKFGYHSVIAFEPIPETFQRLAENCRLNDGRLNIKRRAISVTEGTTVPMEFRSGGPSSMAGASMVDDGQEGYERVDVETISLDAVLASISDDRPILLKLDIEGAEVPVLESSQQIAERDLLIVFEDHGKDDECTSTAWVMAKEWPVFFVHDDGMIQAVNDLATVRRLKTQRHRGYNFVATLESSSFFALISELLETPRQKTDLAREASSP